ncbi:MAG: hypothetical protein WCI43_09700 [Candidatus Firestonebacteria bacterium]
MKKRELIGVVSKILGLFFAVTGLGQFLGFLPPLVSTFQVGEKNAFSLAFGVGVFVSVAVYYLAIIWVLVARTDKVAAFIVKDSENTDLNFGIGREDLQQAVIFAAGVG